MDKETINGIIEKARLVCNTMSEIGMSDEFDPNEEGENEPMINLETLQEDLTKVGEQAKRSSNGTN